MKPISRTDRAAFQGGPRVSVASVNDDSKIDDIDNLVFLPSEELTDIDSANEDGDFGFLEDNKLKKMSDEEIKIKALNLSVNIAKLMSDVTLDSVLKIAAKVAVYIKK